MDELIQTYIPSTVQTCIDVGIPFMKYEHAWIYTFPNVATIELLHKDYETTCYRLKGGTGMGAIFINNGKTTCETIRQVLPRLPSSPILFVVNGDRTLDTSVSMDASACYAPKPDVHIDPSTLQDELDTIPPGNYVLILNPLLSEYTVPGTAQVLYTSDTVVIVYIPEPVVIQVATPLESNPIQTDEVPSQTSDIVATPSDPNPDPVPSTLNEDTSTSDL